MKFKTKLEQGAAKNVVGIVVPEKIVESFGAGKRPPVKITIKGYTYQSSIGVMGGKYMVGVPAQHREAAGVKGGDTVEVAIELDTGTRVVTVPNDLAVALKTAKLSKAFEALAPSRRKEHVRQVEDAKTQETRQRRISKIVETLSGK